MKTAALKCAAWSISLLSLLIALPAKAADLAYAGRLVDSEGAPLAGPVDITLRFFGSAAGSDQLGPTKTFDGVALEGGVFQLTVSLESTDQAAIFGDGTAVVFVEVEAAGKLYPRQRFTPVPLALRIPVDNDSLVYGSDAKLTVGEIAIGQVQGLQAALAQKLDSTPASSAASGYLSSADWTTFNAKQAAITASSSLTAGSLTTASQDAVVIKPYGAQAGETGELRFEEKTGGNYVGFKAPDALAADKVWTLPAADGAAGEVLATDGAGGLSWVALSGANILDATITDAKLQTISAPGKVSGAAITSGTIGGNAAFAGTGGVTTSGNITLAPASAAATQLRFQDDDASNYVAFKAPGTVASNLVLTLPAADGAAGQFLRTDGAGTLTWGSPAGSGDMLASANLNDLTNVATARTNLGLGALATLAAVGSAEITNGSVADADISASAAIATSKLSGALTAVAGHGLGALATASSVTSGEITDSTIVDADISASAAIATSKLSGAVTSIAGHGLGSLASLSSITAAEIGDGEIADADISGSAAIATSKLSGPLTSVSGHGLGTLATLSAVSTSEITDGTIVNADISGTAAIATSKLSGALTAVSGHGLGTLATSSTVSTSEITDGTIANADISTTAAIDSSKIANGSVSSTEFQYLDGVTSSIQTQLDAKASAASPTFTGAISSALGSAAAPSYSFTGDSNTGVWSSGADTVNVSTAGSERLRVTSAGNVGIATTSPAGLLDVKGRFTVLSNGNVGIGTTVPSAPFDIRGGTAGFMTNGSAVRISGQDGNNSAGGNITIMPGLGASGSTTNGFIGIGTTSPVSTVDIRGGIAPWMTSASDVMIVGQEGNNSSGGNIILMPGFGNDGSANTSCCVHGKIGIGTTTPASAIDIRAGTSPWMVNASAVQIVGENGNNSAGGGVVITGGYDRDSLGNNTGNYASITLNPSGGNVGIGTTSPNATLTVSKASDTLWNTPANFFTPDNVSTHYSQMHLGKAQTTGNATALRFYYDADNSNANRTDIGFASVSVPVMSYTRGGNVGIGTTAPLFTLNTPDTGTIATGTLRLQNSYLGTTNNSGSYGIQLAGIDNGTNGHDLRIQGRTSGSGAFSDLVTVKNNGNVGIGTTAPAGPLEVRSSNSAQMRLTGTTANAYTQMEFEGTSRRFTLGVGNGSEAGWGVASKFYLFDSTGGGMRLTVDTLGNVGIGTTSPGYLLHVNGSVAGVGAYNQLSDERYKKDIDDISDSLEKVLAIHGVTYKWIDEERYGSETQIGVLAQEIEKIVPEVVTTGSDGVKRVRYSDLVPLIIEALKREHADRDADGAKKDTEIAQLKAESEQLKAESEQLKAESEQLKAAFCSKFPETAFCSR